MIISQCFKKDQKIENKSFENLINAKFWLQSYNNQMFKRKIIVSTFSSIQNPTNINSSLESSMDLINLIQSTAFQTKIQKKNPTFKLLTLQVIHQRRKAKMNPTTVSQILSRSQSIFTTPTTFSIMVLNKTHQNNHPTEQIKLIQSIKLVWMLQENQRHRTIEKCVFPKTFF